MSSQTLQISEFCFAKLYLFSPFRPSHFAYIAKLKAFTSGFTMAAPFSQIDGVIKSAQETRFVEMVFPEQANHYGTLFGGNALSLMGKAAFVAATRHARCPVVMATSDKIEFHVPVRVGEMVELTANVCRVGRTSMTVAVEMMAEDPHSGCRRLAVRGSFEMVAVDESGRPVPIQTCNAKEEIPS